MKWVATAGRKPTQEEMDKAFFDKENALFNFEIRMISDNFDIPDDAYLWGISESGKLSGVRIRYEKSWVRTKQRRVDIKNEPA